MFAMACARVAAVRADTDLPQAQDGSMRFDFDVATAQFHGDPVPVHGHARLSWYASRNHAPPAIRPCATW